MSGETWLLSAMALSAPANAGTTSYTPEVREAVVVEMQRDCAAAENTFTGFAAVQENIKNASSSREETASALKEQSNTAEKTKREIIFFNNFKAIPQGASGVYDPIANTIAVSFPNVENMHDEKDLSYQQRAMLQHEKHHQDVAHAKIITSDGKEVLAQEAPMGLAQQLNIHNADEIGSTIAECMTIREAYKESLQSYEDSKNKILAALKADEKTAKKSKDFISALKNNRNISIDGNKATFCNDKGKYVSFDLSDKGVEIIPNLKNMKEQEETQRSILTTYAKPNQITPYDEYMDKLAKGEFNPLSNNPDEIKKEMDFIGSSCTKNWMTMYSNLQRAYDFRKQHDQFASPYTDEHVKRVNSFVKEHNFQEIKPNDENYNKALSKTVTICGWDFSNSVKEQLVVDQGYFCEADKMITEGANKLDVIEHLRKKRFFNADKSFGEAEFDIASKIVEGKKVGEHKLKTLPVTWSATDQKDFSSILKQLEEERKYYGTQKDENGQPCNTHGVEEMAKMDKMINNLKSLQDKSSIGKKLTDEQINNLNALSHYATQYQHDVSLAQADGDMYKAANGNIPSYNLDKLSKRIGNASIPNDVKKEWDGVAASLHMKPGSYSYADIKAYVQPALSGIENKKAAEEFQVKETTPEIFMGTKQSKITMTDLNSINLQEQYNQARLAQAKERVGNKLDKTQTVQTTPPAQTATKTSVNMAQLAAQRQGGR